MPRHALASLVRLALHTLGSQRGTVAVSLVLRRKRETAEKEKKNFKQNAVSAQAFVGWSLPRHGRARSGHALRVGGCPRAGVGKKRRGRAGDRVVELQQWRCCHCCNCSTTTTKKKKNRLFSLFSFALFFLPRRRRRRSLTPARPADGDVAVLGGELPSAEEPKGHDDVVGGPGPAELAAAAGGFFSFDAPE